MLIVPMDAARPLVAMGPAVPQVDRETGAQALDRTSKEPLFDVQVVMPTDDGSPLAMRVTVPESGLAEQVGIGSLVKATGLTLITDVKNGKAWYVFKASALTVARG
jgi:hypothetical protein